VSTSWGLKCEPTSGSPLVTATAIGAIFVGKVVCSITSGTQTLDYTAIPFGGMYAVQAGEGVHTWALSNNSGVTRLTFTYAKETYQTNRSTTLYLYATNTIEPDYGVNATNDAGQRLVSTILPNCRFIGKLTMSGTAHKYDLTPSSDTYYMYTNTIAYTPTSGSHSTLVFWSLPNSSDTTLWWQGRTTLYGSAGSMQSTLYYKYGSTAPSVMPEAFAFETGPYMACTTTYGIRVFDADGLVMYDGATPQLVIAGLLTNIDFSTGGTSYTIPSGLTTPAIVFPQYIKEGKQGACSGDDLATLREDFGMLRRTGGTLYGDIQIMNTETDGWDCRDGVTAYYYGNKTGLVVPFIDAADYGGSAV